MSRAAMLLALALALAAPLALAAERHLLVVSGISGEPVYADRFHRWAQTIVDAARDRLGFDASRIAWLAESVERDPRRIAARSTKAQVQGAIGSLAADSAPGDLVAIVLIGHGTARDGRALFNLPGPDLSAEELAESLAALDGRSVVVVDSTPASSPFVGALSAPGRIVITATASENESYHTYFVEHFAAALADAGADADRDGRLSVLEAFEFARRGVARSFDAEGRLVTEHALLDDDGDGVGSREPDPDADSALGDGARARAVTLSATPDETGPRGALRLELEREARSLVERIEALKRIEVGLSREEYDERLETLLVELAFNRRELHGMPR